MKKSIKIALAGNPNAGKTTIFNNLTGARQHVGNYPGVTVEKKEGSLHYGGYEITVVDLPGTYSLTPYSIDEVVARNVLTNESLDVVVNIVDASNLERNLNLTIQLKELGIPLIIAMNMADMADKQGIEIDYALLEILLGAPVVRTIGARNEGTTDILNRVIDIVEGRGTITERPVTYRREIETQIQALEVCMENEEGPPNTQKQKQINPAIKRWWSIKLLENDKDVMEYWRRHPNWPRLETQLRKSRKYIRDILDEESELLLVDGRYAFIRGACRETVKYQKKDQTTISERIDRILLNRILGLPLFLGMMWLLFQLTFTLGALPMAWINNAFAWLGHVTSAHTQPGLLQSLLVDGIIGGVGGVLAFLPNIIMLFLGIALLEDTGYMARAAFVTDKIMHRVGLHGKSFVPLLIGFGCNIPAVLATRTLENEKDRLVTTLVAPLTSCGARLPVYTLLISAFFGSQTAGNILFSIYMIGIILAIVMAKVFRTWLLPGEAEPFVMELPAYRFPTLKSILIHMWERAWLYIKKAGTIILAASIVVWALFAFPATDVNGRQFSNSTEKMEQSYAGHIGHAAEPILRPLGFDWRTSVALLAGFTAKEVVVSTMGTLYSIDDGNQSGDQKQSAAANFAQQAREKSGMTPLVAYVLMIFTLLYVPCMATVATIKRETNGWKWPVFTISYTFALAWGVSYLVYRAGILLGMG